MIHLDRFSIETWAEDGVMVTSAAKAETSTVAPKRKEPWPAMLAMAAVTGATLVCIQLSTSVSSAFVSTPKGVSARASIPTAGATVKADQDQDAAGPEYWRKVQRFIRSVPRMPDEDDGPDPESAF